MREAIRDKERLMHIDDAINRLIKIPSVELDRIQEGSLEYYGLVKIIEIIGEAVYMLTKEFKDSNTDAPWRQIERMRHVLVHGYYSVGFDFVKEVIIADLPVLRRQILQYLSELDSSR